MRKGDRVSTPDGPGTVRGEWLSRGLRRFGPFTERDIIVELDEGKGQWRRIYRPGQLRLIHREAGKA